MDSVEQLFERVMKAMDWNKQQLAAHLGLDSTILSQKLGRHWNSHWRVFIRLLPLLLQLKIVTSTGEYVTSDNARDPEDKPVKTQENYRGEGQSNDITETLPNDSFILH